MVSIFHFNQSEKIEDIRLFSERLFFRNYNYLVVANVVPSKVVELASRRLLMLWFSTPISRKKGELLQDSAGLSLEWDLLLCLK